MSALDDVLARLHGVRESGAGFVAQCPAHEDRHQSLSVGAGQDRAVVFNCHACRAAGDAIVIALGLDPREILGARRNGDVVPFRASRSETRRPAVTSRTVYRVEGYEHVRLELEDGSKAFVWRHEGRNGLPDGVRGEDLLYGAEQLDELADGVTVVLCEGEKASDALRAAGIAAVATVTGAAGTPSATSLERLTRFDVVLWADNDAPGLGHMQRTADRLVGLGTTPRWVVWQHAPAKGDAADAPPEERARLVSEAGTYRPEIHSSGTTIFKPDERINLFRSAREITAQTPATPRWILAGYIAAGAITEPDGKLKASGKTTFMLAAIAKIVEGRPFLGRATIASGVILLTEQNSTSLAVALGRAGLSDRDDVQVMFWSDARGLTWPAIVQLAADEARSRGYQLVIVDTLPQFAGISGDGENSSGAALEAMRPIQEAAATGLGFLISRHERKGGGEVGESARGSSAFSGAVDIVLSLRRSEGQGADTVRTIQALSRFDETPAELVIDLVNGEYVALGTGPDVRLNRARDAVLADLPISEDQAVARDEIVEAHREARIKPTMIHEILKAAVEAGTVQRSGTGKKGNPYRYWKSHEIHSSGTTGAPDESIPDDDGAVRCANCGVMPVDLPGLDCEHCLGG